MVTTRLPLRDNLIGQGIVLTTLTFMTLGLVFISSTSGTLSERTAWYNRPDVRQAMYAPVALLILCLFWRLDYHLLDRRPWAGVRLLRWIPAPAMLLVILGLALSAVVLIPHVGFEVGGQRRWLKFGPVQFQPSEVLKIALLIYLAVFLSRRQVEPKAFVRTFLPLIGLTGLSVMLVIEYNFSTAAVMGVAAAAVMLMGGVRWFYLLGLAVPAAAGFYAYVVREPHRWERITVFLDPWSKTNPASFQPWQSLIWIAAGANPPGLGAGVAKYGYLPEDDTDFIFTTVSYETGIVGAVVVIGLLLVWLYLVRRSAIDAADRQGSLLAAGLGFAIILQAALHIAVTLVVVPTTGISLPFVSVGGTALWIMSAATAVIISVTARREADASRLPE